MDEFIPFLMGGIIGIGFMGAFVLFSLNPSVMEQSAELFCNKDGQKLLEYDSSAWTFKSITCGGSSEKRVFERNYEDQKVKTFDVFEEK